MLVCKLDRISLTVARGVLGAAILLSGCFLRRPVSVTPQMAHKACGNVGHQVSAPSEGAENEVATVYLVNRGWRLSLVLRSEDAVEELGWMVDETHNHPWVEFAWGYGDNVIPPEDILPTSSLIPLTGAPFFLARGLPSKPHHDLEKAEITSLSFPRVRLAAVLLGVKSGIAPSETGASTVIGTANSKTGTIYKGAVSDSAGKSTVKWIAQRISEAGCPVDPTSGRVSRLLGALGKLPPNTRHD